MGSTATTTRNCLIDIADVAEELVEPHRHVEMVTDRDPADRRKRRRRAWATTQPGLITQLGQAAQMAASAPGEGSGASVPGSRPPGSWEALARHTAITAYVTRWCWSLKLDIRDTVEQNVRALVGAAAGLDDDTAAALLSELRAWRHQAAVMTGWSQPDFAPAAVPCPVVDCTKVSTLRINVDRMVALCTACGSVWDDEDGSIRALARHIEAVSATTTPRPARVRSGKQGNGGWLTGQALAS